MITEKMTIEYVPIGERRFVADCIGVLEVEIKGLILYLPQYRDGIKHHVKPVEPNKRIVWVDYTLDELFDTAEEAEAELKKRIKGFSG